MDKEKKPKLTPVFKNFEAALKTWWKNLKKIVFVYLWGLLYALVPMAVVALFLGLSYWLGDRAGVVGVGFRVATVFITVLGSSVALYFIIRAYMSVFLLVKHDYSGKTKEIFKETRELFWSYIGLAVTTILFILPYFFLLIVPGIIYAVLFTMFSSLKTREVWRRFCAV